MTTCRHISGRVALVLAALAVVASASVAAATAAGRAATTGGYGWPVKPFDREHPVRGFFGDPRTLFKAPPTVRGLMQGGGSFSFHQGIDISAPDGTAVYPVASGTVTVVSREWVRVDSGGGRMFEYWHIAPLVREGQTVAADATVLGRIVRGAEHVHLTEYEGGRVVNPLQAGHLGPYTDTTSPRVASISFRRGAGGPAELPNFIRGKVELVASAYDLPTKPVPGIWRGMPTTPALLTWRIQKWKGRVVVPERVAYDHRATEPDNSLFWSSYARGTFQNMAVFGKHYSYLARGSYLFKLTPGLFDTRGLRDGVYELVVTATDARGNRDTLSERFLVHNRAGWVGS